MSLPSARSFSQRGGLSAVLCIAAVTFGAGCSAEAEIPEVVVTRTDVPFLGVPSIPGFTDGTQEITSEFEHPDDFELPDMNPELHPLSARILARDGMSSLGFLEHMTVTLYSNAEGAPRERLELATYERAPNATVGRVVELDIDRDADVLSYWNAGGAMYEMTLSGVLPEQDWSIDVSFSFSGQLSVSSSA